MTKHSNSGDGFFAYVRTSGRSYVRYGFTHDGSSSLPKPTAWSELKYPSYEDDPYSLGDTCTKNGRGAFFALFDTSPTVSLQREQQNQFMNDTEIVVYKTLTCAQALKLQVGCDWGNDVFTGFLDLELKSNRCCNNVDYLDAPTCFASPCTCAQDTANAEDLAWWNNANVNPITAGITVPGQGTANTFRTVSTELLACCGGDGFPSYEIDTTYTRTYEAETDVQINLSNAFGTSDASRFADLCEDLWVCNAYVEQYNEFTCSQSRCPTYTERSLCFDQPYKTGNDDEFDKRLEFIFDECYGFGSNVDVDFNGSKKTNPLPDGMTYSDLLDELEKDVESTCSFATSLSNRRNFDSNFPLCNALYSCILEQTRGNYDSDAEQEEAFERFDNFTLCAEEDSVLETRLEQCEAGDLTGNTYNFQKVCPAEFQEYYTSFPPDYPKGNNYESVFMEKSNFKLVTDLGARTDAVDVGDKKNLLFIFSIVTIGFEIIANALPDSIEYAWRALPWEIAAGIEQIYDYEIERADIHDGNIDSAEIEATYENTRQVLDGMANIWSNLECISSIDGTPRRGQGCDGIDNDCDDIIDDCKEDSFPPEVDATAASECSGIWFKTKQEALACIAPLVKATDDCDPNVAISGLDVASTTGDCDAVNFSLSATANTCNVASAESATVAVKVDGTPPVVTCQVGGNTNAVLVLPESNIVDNEMTTRFDYMDVGFSYEAQLNPVNDCDGDLEVKIDVYSSEMDFGEQAQKKSMSSIFGREDGVQPDIFLLADYCTGNAPFCITDPALGKSTVRKYTIVVRAFDQAGNEAVSPAECTVGVVSPGGAVPDFSQSTQRFLLASYSEKATPPPTDRLRFLRTSEFEQMKTDALPCSNGHGCLRRPQQ